MTRRETAPKFVPPRNFFEFSGPGDIARLVAFLIAFVGVPGLADAQSLVSGLINDSDSSIIFTTFGSEGTGPTWNIGDTSPGSQPRNYLNDEHYSNFTTTPVFQVLGAAAVVNFIGTDITWIGKIGPNFGIASYSVDGGAPMTFDAYTANLIAQNNNVVVSNLPNGAHSLKIEVTPFKNAASSDFYQVIDAFNITGSPLPLYRGTVAGYNSPQLSLSGPWTCGPNPSDLSGGHCYTNATNASISWTFTGSLIEVFGRPNAENGIFNVFIDGTRVGQVDSHFGTPDIDQLNGYGLFQAKVASGTHTITLVNTGMSDTGAIGTFIQIDMFVAFPDDPGVETVPRYLEPLADRHVAGPSVVLGQSPH
jgi:hypothetical protein